MVSRMAAEFSVFCCDLCVAAAAAAGLKTAVFSGKDVGGTCVNRGCVPSKALLAASGRVREMQDDHHLDGMGIKVRCCCSVLLYRCIAAWI